MPISSKPNHSLKLNIPASSQRKSSGPIPTDRDNKYSINQPKLIDKPSEFNFS